MICIHVAGWVFLVIITVFFVFKMHVLYSVTGDSPGAKPPTLDAILFFPPFVTFGLWLARVSRHDTSVWWQHVLLWLGLTILAVAIYWVVDRFGKMAGAHS